MCRITGENGLYAHRLPETEVRREEWLVGSTLPFPSCDLEIFLPIGGRPSPGFSFKDTGDKMTGPVFEQMIHSPFYSQKDSRKFQSVITFGTLSMYSLAKSEKKMKGK